MRTILFIIVIIGNSWLTKAQIVSIPDPIFKARLLAHNPIIDSNSDGEIQVSEALAFTGDMNVSSASGDPNGIIDLTGLDAFGNLEGFTANNNPLTTADFSGNTALEDIMMNNTSLESINIQNNQALKTISITNSDLTSFTVSNKPNLLLTQVNLSDLTSLNISNCPSLQFIYVQSNLLESINLSVLPSLFILNVGNNPLLDIDLSDLSSLLFLMLDVTSLSYINASELTELIQLNVRNNDVLEYINLKNGNNENMDISGGSNSCNFENTPNLTEVCVDALDSTFTNFIQDQTSQTVAFSTECILGNEIFEKPQMTLYPNPSEGKIYLKGSFSVNRITIYTSNGLKIKEIKNSSPIKHFSINSFPSGMYLIQMESEKGTLALKKLIKS